MTSAVPLSVEQQILSDTQDFARSFGYWDDHDKAVFDSLWERCEDLARNDAATASLIKARLCSFVGDFDGFQYWINNARKMNAGNRVDSVVLAHYINQGFAVEGLALAHEIIAERNYISLAHICTGILALGGNTLIVESIQNSIINNEVIGMTSVLEKSKELHEIMQELDIDDDQVAGILSVAGEFLRKKRISWASGSLDILGRSSAEGGPFIRYNFPIQSTPSVAADLNWELAEEIIDRGMENLGVTVAVLGEVLE